MYFKEMKIKYPRGSIILNLNCFFPATVNQIRKLYKTIEITDNPDEVVDKLVEYLQERMLTEEQTMRKSANDLLDHKTAYEEKKKQYESGKRPNGVPIRKDQLPAFKKSVNKLNEEWRRDKRVYDMAMREQKKLAKNRILLLTLNGRC